MCFLSTIAELYSRFLTMPYIQRKSQRKWKNLVKLCETDPLLIDEDPPEDELILKLLCGRQVTNSLNCSNQHVGDGDHNKSE